MGLRTRGVRTMSTQQQPGALERGQRADIHSYVSGHLGGHRGLTETRPQENRGTGPWPASRNGGPAEQGTPGGPPGPRVNGPRVKDAPLGSTTLLPGPRQPRPGPGRSDPAQIASRPPWSEEEVRRRVQVLRSQRGGPQREARLSVAPQTQTTRRHDLLWGQKAGRTEVERHERKLQKGLEKLSVQSWPSRDRLAAFSDVFEDVCDSSTVFGGILREIKAEYDLNINYVFHSQSSLLTKMAPPASLKELEEGAATAKAVDQAEAEISRLEEEIQRALEAGTKVRNELQAVRAVKDKDEKAPVQADAPALPPPTSTSASSRVRAKRLQVWSVWREVQQLKEEMKDKMVPVLTAAATEKCIRDTKAEVLRVSPSNHRLQITNKELEEDINVALKRMRGGEVLRRELWGNIWTSLPPETDSCESESYPVSRHQQED